MSSQLITSTQNFTIPSNVKTLTVKVYGAGGGGGGLTANLQSGATNYPGGGFQTAPDYGTSRAFGLAAGGGQGGGDGGIGQGGNQGGFADEFGWGARGASVSGQNGSPASGTTGGAGANGAPSGGNGGDNGIFKQTGTLEHYFNNVTNLNTQISGTGASFTAQQLQAEDGIPCNSFFLNTSAKHYLVNWFTPFPNNNYTITGTILVFETASSGVQGQPVIIDNGISVCASSDITANGFRIQFKRTSGSITFIRSFSVNASWIGQFNNGGGGGGYIEATITREQLLTSGTYLPGTTHLIKCGEPGTGGGQGISGVNPGGNGGGGFVALSWTTLQTLYVKHQGSWKGANDIYIKQSNQWLRVKNAYIKEGGIWKKFYG